VLPETGIFASTARWRVDAEQSIMRKSELRSFIWRAEADALLPHVFAQRASVFISGYWQAAATMLPAADRTPTRAHFRRAQPSPTLCHCGRHAETPTAANF
jgi:hypothetical protein